MFSRSVLCAAAAALALAACGTKGPLTLPPKPGDTTTRHPTKPPVAAPTSNPYDSNKAFPR
ncbi:LPS translocon maturation chaperone LptM [Methyloversatilis thermotolerans]|uniref:LPS translocon maturation chaperone LptM n=1 Tax=Methyloversatilis thermotolerans TaxID=1346290 RepID=UPI0009819859|nr:lipoprotein [Methyloversatilis thermotolerans]